MYRFSEGFEREEYRPGEILKVTFCFYTWDEGRLSRNKQAHLTNGNTAGGAIGGERGVQKTHRKPEEGGHQGNKARRLAAQQAGTGRPSSSSY